MKMLNSTKGDILYKILLTITLFFVVNCQEVIAATAYPWLVSIVQPDGSKLRIYLRGDEHLKWAESEDGYSLLYNAKGIFEYAQSDSNGNLKPSGIVAKDIELRDGKSQALLQNLQKHSWFSKSQVSMFKQIWNMTKAATLPTKSFPSTGTRKLLCILVGFTDKSFSKTKTEFFNLFNQVGYSANAATGSVRDFFTESSYGKFKLDVTVAGPYTAAHNMAYYGANDTNGNDTNPEALITEAINLAAPGINYADFDNTGDGTVDGLYVIYAGWGEENTGVSANAIWAHSGSINPVVLDGKTISRYSCSSELSGNSGSTLTNIGVICHEFGHILGAPDFYDTNNATDGQYDGTGFWDLQSAGSWNNNAKTPAQPNPYTKCYLYNWASATTLTSSQTITLNNAAQNSTSFYRYLTTTPNEYFLIENRQQVGFDTYLPGHGLLVYHVDGDYVTAHYSANDINTGSHQGMFIMAANSTVGNGVALSPATTYSAACPFPGTGSITQFTDNTTPNSKSWASANTSKPITNISENVTNKTVTLNFMGGYICSSPANQATNFSASSIADNSMTINWTRGSGFSVLVVARASGPVNSDPFNGIAYAADAAFGSGSEIGTGNFVVYNGTSTKVDITKLVAGTTYYFAIYEYASPSICYKTAELTGNALTTGVAPCSVCPSAGTINFKTSITKVSFNTINNISAKPSGYSDYTAISTTVIKNSVYPINVKINTDGNFTALAFAWIDWNQNCLFDVNEGYDLGSANNTADGLTSFSPLNITVPSSALPGTTKMRVSCKYSTSPTSCDTNFDGEVEDYTIEVSSCPLVTITTQPAVSQSACILGSTSFTVGASSSTTPLTYQWQFNNGTAWNNVSDGTPAGAVYANPSSPVVSVSGITNSGSYRYRCFITYCNGENNVASDMTTLNVDAASVGGSITGLPASITYGSSTGILTLNGYKGNIQRWQRKLGNGSWQDIPNTLETYSETPSSVGTWYYRAVVKNGSCTEVYSAESSFTVDKQLITITASANTKTYDGDVTASSLPTITSGTLATGDTGIFIETYDTKAQGSGKTLTPAVVSIRNAGNSDKTGNYTITLVSSANGIINKRAITITAAANTKVYDGDVTAFALPTITNGTLATGETGTFNETYNTKTQGTGKTLTPAVVSIRDAINADVSVNYTVALTTSSNGVINPQSLSIFASNLNKCAGETMTFAGTEFNTGYIVSGDAVTSLTLTSAGTPANAATGSYDLIPSDAVGTGLSNYAITYTKGTLTVSASPSPIVSGPLAVCSGSAGNIYFTPNVPGQTYSWTISGGTITSGAGTNAITVTWGGGGSGWVKVVVSTVSSPCKGTSSPYNVAVNPFPTISGSSSPSVSSTGNVYATESGMTGYNWVVSSGGTITSGGGTNNNSVTVAWNTLGNESVSVNYTNGNGCTSTAPIVKSITVVTTSPPVIPPPPVTIPVPTISGTASVCATTAGNVYATEGGMTGYQWNVSYGGTITSGGTSTSPAITVTWNAPGAQTVSVNYTNSSGGTAVAPTVKNVAVNPLPAPTITGLAAACEASTGNVYTTETGMTGYQWIVSSGGTITAGTATRSITVTWNTPGAQKVSVNYRNNYGCAINTATAKNVTVNPLPVPTITGPASVCAKSSGNTYTTETAMTGYTWSVSAGGTIISGSDTNTILVTWNTPGAQTVGINYANASGCKASSTVIKNVTVNPVLAPTITGPATACAGTTGLIYSTESAMLAYSWNISSGGTITSGAGTNTITVNWNTAGSQTISVNYNNTFGCAASSATVKNIVVNSLPVPTITGNNTLCAGAAGVTYATEAGMTSYNWTVPASGTITAGAGTNLITVTWNAAGAQTVAANYTNAGGCNASLPTVRSVTVNPLSGSAGAISGKTVICGGSLAVAYSIVPIANVTGYVWTLPVGASIASGTGTTNITVNYTAYASSGIISVYGTNTCGNSNTSTLAVSVTPLPVAAGSITGPAAVCQGSTGLSFTVVPIANSTSYTWSIPTGATIVSGGNTNSIVLDLGMSTVSGKINVYGENNCGKGAASPSFNLVVNLIPPTPSVSVAGVTVVSSAAEGNQWYFSPAASDAGTAIAGATSQNYTPTQTGWYWTKVTLNGCTSGTSIRLLRLKSGEENRYNIYPVPNNGEFTVAITTPNQQEFTIIVYDQLGQKTYEEPGLLVNGDFKKTINLQPVSTGVYSVVLKNKDGNEFKRKINVKK